MLDILNDYLNDAASHELKELIKEAINTFDRVEVPNYDDGFTEILMNDNTVDFGDTIFNIINLTKVIQKQILAEHEIVLVDESSIATYTLFINGILDIQEYSDKDALLKAISMDGNVNELLAEVLSLVTHKTADELLINIETVSDAFIGTLKNLLEDDKYHLTEEEVILKQKLINKFTKFCEYCNNIKTPGPVDVIKMLSTGISVGYPFLIYSDIIGRDLESKKDIDAAYELVGMAMISSDGNENPISIIKENIDQYISSIDMITKITIIVSDIVLGLNKL